MKRNKYEQVIEDTLDLHGLYADQAVDEVHDFLERAVQKKYTIVRIITGKGIHSAGEPVLRKIVKDILLERGFSFRDAKIQEGGSGALILKIHPQ